MPAQVELWVRVVMSEVPLLRTSSMGWTQRPSPAHMRPEAQWAWTAHSKAPARLTAQTPPRAPWRQVQALQQSALVVQVRRGAGASGPQPLKSMSPMRPTSGRVPTDGGPLVQGTSKGEPAQYSGPHCGVLGPAGTVGSAGWLSARVQRRMVLRTVEGMP